ncbi:CidA/LrgA family protein [Ostreiculturibacter nitratireducens]|uniref:CidA/LrgA family protein n=1 Tax=Ostreiculturibacter nitratireducens TaxID=3075226 RepID=UPI0031B5C53B
MIPALATILAFQLAGEAAARAFDLPLPGPVLGMVALVAAFLASPRLAAAIRPTAQGLLAHLSLLFVPAGVGVVAHMGVLRDEGLGIFVALVVSTILAIAVGAVTFAAVARITGDRGDV